MSSPPTSSTCSLHSCPDIPQSISDDPRIQALLKCNGPPGETERVSLLATASESSNLLSVLKEKIDCVQQILNVLLDGQVKVTENLRAAERLLHPIRSIPDDILRYIFSFCVYEIYDILTEWNAPDSLDSRNPPWTLSHVCRSWRRVALSTATLWSCLSVDFEQCRGPKTVRLHQFMLGLHLQRAHHCQLTIRLSSTYDVSSHASIPILLTSIPFWRHLRARIPAESLAVFSHYGPYLESLHYLQIGLPIRHDDTVSTIHAFDMAQNLRILDLHSMLCRHFHLPDGGNRLTKLVLQGPFYQHIFSFLSKTPNLESLKLYIEASEPFERLSSPIMMPKLTSLEIAEWNDAAPSSVACFFESLALPTLSLLQIGLDNDAEGATVLIFPEILPHHHCHEIIKLMVTAPGSEIAEISLLTHITNMRHLSVAAKIVDKNLISALTRSGNNDDILPRLRTFDLRGSESIPDHKIILEMVESRMKGQTGHGEQGLQMLEEVFLDGPLTFGDFSLALHWQALQNKGLIVNNGG